MCLLTKSKNNTTLVLTLNLICPMYGLSNHKINPSCARPHTSALWPQNMHDEKINGVKEVCFCYTCTCFVVESGLTCCLWWKNKGNEELWNGVNDIFWAWSTLLSWWTLWFIWFWWILAYAHTCEHHATRYIGGPW
jgi:hypothetical protein